MNVFLDTEFTNFYSPSLISIALVAESGAEFYAEVPYSTSECSDFVLEIVIPRLSKSAECQYTSHRLKMAMESWLRHLEGDDGELVIVLFDSQTDWDLFAKALDFQIPSKCYGKFLPSEIDDDTDELYSAKGLEEHNALHDARVGLLKFLNVQKRS